MSESDSRGWLPIVGLGAALVAFSSSGEASPDPDPQPNDPPAASFSRSTDGLTVTADGSTSDDPDGSIRSYAWEALAGGNVLETQSGQTFQYTFASGGSYELRLTVTDTEGKSDTASETFSLSAPDPNESPSVSFTGLSTSGSTLSVSASGSDPDGSIRSYSWALYRDGSQVDSASGANATLELAGSGDYTAEVTVTDNDGATASDSYSFSYTADGGGGGSNESPSVSVTGLSTSGDTLNVSASGSDPDGSIVRYAWTLTRDGTAIDTATGSSASLSLGGSGQYVAKVTATDDDGATASDSYSFEYTSDGGSGGGSTSYDHTAEISKQVSDWSGSASDPYVDFETTGDLKVASGSLTVDGQSATGTIGEYETVTIEYNGSIRIVDWNESPIILRVDGSRVDPYDVGELPAGPRERWTGGSGGVIEVTIYQTAKLFARHGYAPARTSAHWISGALKDKNISHDILYDLPVIASPSQSTRCRNPYDGSDPCYGDDSCSSWSCCSAEDSMPAAYYWWRAHLHDGDLPERYSQDIGQSYDIRGDDYVQRKDSNLLLTDTGSGGCAAVTGRQGAIGADAIYSEIGYDDTPDSSVMVNQIHNIMHEMGHNLGYSHAQDDCSKGGGRAWIDGQGRWNRTPCVPGNGCTNMCGYAIENRANTTSNTVIFHPYYTECTAEQFRSYASGETGNVQHIRAPGGAVDGERGDEMGAQLAADGGCGCGCDDDCEEKTIETDALTRY